MFLAREGNWFSAWYKLCTCIQRRAGKFDDKVNHIDFISYYYDDVQLKSFSFAIPSHNLHFTCMCFFTDAFNTSTTARKTFHFLARYRSFLAHTIGFSVYWDCTTTLVGRIPWISLNVLPKSTKSCWHCQLDNAVGGPIFYLYFHRIEVCCVEKIGFWHWILFWIWAVGS